MPSLAAPSAAAIQEPKDLAGFQALQTQIQAVVRKALPLVVGISDRRHAGSGVIVSEDGIVMTAGHVVIKPGQAVTFFLSDWKPVKGITLGLSANADAGLMKITEPGKWPFVPLGDSASLKPGMWCLAIGHPLGYHQGRPPVVRVGRILQKSESMIQTDCPLVGGDSGGPLIDLDGKVIGINSRIAGPTDVNLHVPVNVFREMWDQMLKGQAVQPVLPGRDGPDVKRPSASLCRLRTNVLFGSSATGRILPWERSSAPTAGFSPRQARSWPITAKSSRRERSLAGSVTAASWRANHRGSRRFAPWPRFSHAED